MSEPFSDLCEWQPLDGWSSQASYSSARNNCDFNTISSQDGPNSSSRPLDADAGSYSSPSSPKSIKFPPSPTRLLVPGSPWPVPQQAAQSFPPAPFSSASPSPPTKLRVVHCGQCQVVFNDVQSALKHVTDRHRDTGHSHWPCIVPNCGNQFRHEKDLRRHLDDQHLDIKYTCSCGHRARRDKHKSHIKVCQTEGNGFYTCQCGNTTRGLNGHLLHIEEKCPLRRKKGRPSKTKKN